MIVIGLSWLQLRLKGPFYSYATMTGMNRVGVADLDDPVWQSQGDLQI